MCAEADESQHDGGVVSETQSRVAEEPEAEAESASVRALVFGLVIAVASIAYTNWATVLLRASRVNRSHFPMALLFPFAWCLVTRLPSFFPR